MATLITLVDGTVPVAADFNTNFINLNTEIRPNATGGTAQSTYAKGDLLYASAANTLSKRPIGVQGLVLSVDSNGVPVWGGSALYKSGANISIASSTNETSLLGPLSVGANTLSTANRLRILVVAQLTNTSGGAVNYTYRLKFGATTLCTKAQSVANGSSGFAFVNESELLADAATNAQLGRMLTTLNVLTVDQQIGTSAIDTTAAANLDVTMQLGTSSANATFTMLYAMVELVA